MPFRSRTVLPIMFLLCTQACTGPVHTSSAVVTSIAPTPVSVNANKLSGITIAGRHTFIVSEADGLLVINNNAASQLAPGHFEQLDSRPAATGQYHLLTINQQTLEPVLITVESNPVKVSRQQPLSRPAFQVDGLCLFEDSSRNLFAFFLDGYGGGEMRWLVEGNNSNLVDKSVKPLRLPPGAETCSVDDPSQALFVGEQAFGVWRYPAAAETRWHHQLVDAVVPYGPLANEITSVHADNHGQLWIATGEELSRYRLAGSSDSRNENSPAKSEQLPATLLARYSFNTLASEPEIAAISSGNTRVLVVDEETDTVLHLPVALTETEMSTGSKSHSLSVGAALPVIPAVVETAPMAMKGDAADDPAIWLSPDGGLHSRVLGTNKKWGLMVYNLEGELLQKIPSGHINNIDIRQQVLLEGKRVDIAVASNRSDNSLTFYNIDPRTGDVSEWARTDTGLNDVYGICFYHPRPESLFAIVNDKDGRVQRYAVTLARQKIVTRLVDEFRLPSQPEGCVVNDLTGELFIGEEDAGVWRILLEQNALEESGLEQSASEQKAPHQLVIPVGDNLVADVEGLALATAGSHTLLLVSSQGDNSYRIFNAEPPYEYRGGFRIGLNSKQGIDGTSETDGLALKAGKVGSQFGSGLLVIQDGFNVMPEDSQNFKFVSWQAVIEQLNLQ